MPQPASHDPLFGDGDFAWVEPAPEPAVSLHAPAPVRPRRRKRTLASDLRALDDLVVRGLDAVPLWALAAVLAGLAALVVAVTLGRSDDGGVPARQEAARTVPSQAPAPVEPAAAPLGNAQTVAHGDRGPAVLGIQAGLLSLGMSTAAPDGDFRDGTAAAVSAFQQDGGLAPDGVVGPETADLLRAALAQDAREDAAAVEESLDGAAAAGRLAPASAERYRTLLTAVVGDLERLPLARGGYLALVLDRVAAQAPDYDEPRALALFGMLEGNRGKRAARALAAGRRDVVDGDGVVHRFFPGHGFQFHPLAGFARLNGLVAKEAREEARRLAAALVARGVPAGGALTWEYYFPFGGPPRWTSALAQSVGAQALARAGVLLGDRELLASARRAYLAVPATLSRPLAGGTWVREYGFSDSAILNAQLQSLVSLSAYAEAASDGRAAAFAGELAEAARTLLPEFDTGCWSLYMLGGNPAPAHYHAYHVSLLKSLARKTGDPVWATTAARWDDYQQAQPGGCA